MKSKESLITVGRIIQSRGLRGEVVASAISDDPARFNDFGHVVAIDKAGNQTNHKVEKVQVRKRKGRDEVVLQFEGVDTREASDALRGQVLCVDREELVLDDNEYFLFDLVGVQVETLDGETIGSVTEVRRMPAQDLFVIHRDNDHEVLIPDVPAFVDKSLLGERKLIVNPIEGLLDI